jgi:hypothetical protein
LFDTPLYFLLGVLKSLFIVTNFHVLMIYVGSLKILPLKYPKYMAKGLA